MGLEIKDLYFSDLKSLKYEKSKKIILFGAGIVAKKLLNN